METEMVDEPVAQAENWADALRGGRRTAHEFVRETLRRAILRGDLTGGERLIQGDLATTLNVSTTPVREALRDLATEGLITLDRHRGGTVRGLNWEDMEEIVLIREQLEPLAIRRACERINETSLHNAEKLRQAMGKEKDLGNWVELNTQFHFLFHAAIEAPRLTVVLNGLEEAAAVYVAQAQRWHPEIRRRANEQHQSLVEACRQRNVDSALRAMKGHSALPIRMTKPEERRRR
jgi:DNA-binding GntR family transcriptional regulator